MPLRFAWPAGTEAHVTARMTRYAEDGMGGVSDLRIEGDYTLSVRSHARGLLLDPHGFRTTGFHQEPAAEPDDPTPELARRLGVYAPDYVVSSSGELLDVAGLGEATAIIDDVMRPLRQALDTLPEGRRIGVLLDQLTGEEQFRVQANELWGAQTGLWAGRSLVPGRPERVTAEQVTPVAPGRPISFTADLTLAGAVPCRDGEAALRCVRLELVSTADPRALERTLRAVLMQMGVPEGMPIPLENLRQENRITVVAEPGTLLPHRFEVVRDLEGSMKRGSITMPYRQQDVVQLEYAYPGR